MIPKPSAGPRRTFIRFDFLGRSTKAYKALAQARKGREITYDINALADSNRHVLHFPSQLRGRSLQLGQRLMYRVEQGFLDMPGFSTKPLVLLLDGGDGFSNAFERLSRPGEDSMVESKVDEGIRNVLVHPHRCCGLPRRRLRGSLGSERNADVHASQPKSSIPLPLS